MKIPKHVIAWHKGKLISAVDPNDLEDLGDVEEIDSIDHPIADLMFEDGEITGKKCVVVAQTVDRDFHPIFVVDFEGKRYSLTLKIADDWWKRRGEQTQ